MDIKKYVKKSLCQIIYTIIVIIYLVFLNSFNHELINQNFVSPVKILMYDNYAAVWYFVYAVILFVIGCILVYREAKKLKGLEEFEEIIVSLVIICVILTLLFLIIVFIDNPILKAILTLMFGVCGYVYATTN